MVWAHVAQEASMEPLVSLKKNMICLSTSVHILLSDLGIIQQTVENMEAVNNTFTVYPNGWRLVGAELG